MATRLLTTLISTDINAYLIIFVAWIPIPPCQRRADLRHHFHIEGGGVGKTARDTPQVAGPILPRHISPALTCGAPTSTNIYLPHSCTRHQVPVRPYLPPPLPARPSNHHDKLNWGSVCQLSALMPHPDLNQHDKLGHYSPTSMYIKPTYNNPESKKPVHIRPTCSRLTPLANAQ